MKILVLAGMTLAVVSLGASGAYQKKPKPPDVEVLETRAQRGDGRILVDGRVRATGEKPLRGLVVIFDLISPENGVVASVKAILDEDTVESGQERGCQSVTSDHARAVRYKIRAFDRGERELRVANGGPFPIE